MHWNKYALLSQSEMYRIYALLSHLDSDIYSDIQDFT